MKKSIFIIFTLNILLYAFQGLVDPSAGQRNSEVPLGVWIYSGYEDTVSIYYSARHFVTDKPGIAFLENHEFIERTSG